VRTPAKTKQDLNDGNTVFAVAGVGVGLLSLVPALAPITVPLRIVAAGLGLCGIGLKVVAERDPPDPDYRQIAKPVPTPIPAELSPSSSTQVSEALQALSGNLSRSIALSRTLVTTLNREHTAARAGAVAPERQQMAAAAGYAEQLAGSLTEYAGVARAAASALLAAKLPDPSIQSLKRYRSKLKSATMIGALVKLGASPSEARATANRMYAEASSASARGPGRSGDRAQKRLCRSRSAHIRRTSQRSGTRIDASYDAAVFVTVQRKPLLGGAGESRAP
jgi:hypothetical protein